MTLPDTEHFDFRISIFGFILSDMYLGIDVGGTKSLIAAFKTDGTLLEKQRFPTPSSYDEWLTAVAAALALLKTSDFQTGCVAVPGKVDRTEGIVLAFGNLKWRNVPIQADLERLVHCPITVENDAKAGGLSEALELKDHYRRVVYVTIGTGIGTAIIIDGAIDPDFVDSEGGHMKLEHNGKLQDWESFASGKAIVKLFGHEARDITDASTWKTISRNIAAGLLDLIAVLQPEIIIIGGGVGVHYDRFGKYLENYLKQYENPLMPIPPIQQAKRPEEAVIYGCYALAKSKYASTHS